MSIGLIVVAAIALLMLAAAAWLLSLAQGRERSEEAMSRLQAGVDQGGGLVAADAPEMDIPGIRWLSLMLWRSGSDLRPRSVLIAVLALIALLVLLFLVADLLVAGLISAGLLLVLYLFLVQRVARWRGRIIEQLPQFLENVIRIMSAGNSLEESVGTAARESDAPLQPVFLSIARQVKMGAPIDQVMSQAGDIYRLRDVKIMSLAAGVNRRYGGSLRGVLKSLILAIRQRGIAAKELRALTAETRFSAMILVLVPLFLTSWIYFTNPTFYNDMWRDPLGKKVLIGGVVWMLSGVFILWRMVNSIGDED
ncbi:MAG: type II secretion system F family protein [Nevskia sp.]|nr:type II secretion system F family protein [Nevskia sp.]